jgi:hypothetical protein
MGWVKLLQLLLTVANTVSRIIHDEKLMTAGEARQTARSIAAMTERLGIAREVAAEVAALSDADLDAELRGD